MDKKNLEINQLVSSGYQDSKNKKISNFFKNKIYISIFGINNSILRKNFLFSDSLHPATTGLVSFLDLPLCENVQKV